MQEPAGSQDDPYKIVRPRPRPFTGSDIIAIFRRRLRLVITTMVLITGLSIAVAAGLTPHYQAKTSILITGYENRLISTTPNATAEQQVDQAAIDTRTRLLTSRSFAETVISELDLVSDAYFNPALGPQNGDDGPSLADRMLAALPDIGFTAPGVAEQELEDETALPPGVHDPLDVAVSKLLGGLSVRQEGLSSIITVGFTSPSPKMASDITNSVAELFMNSQLTDKQKANKDAAEWLSKRVEELRDMVINDENAIAQYRQANQLTEDRRYVGDDEIPQLRKDLIAMRAGRVTQQGKLRIVERAIESGEAVASISEIMESPVIRSLRERELNLARNEAQLSQEFGPNHPKVIELNAEKQRLQDGIGFELGNIKQLLLSELNELTQRELSLTEELEAAKALKSAKLEAEGQAEVQLNELERTAEANRNLYTSFLTQLKELNERRELIIPGARIISKAVTPTSPSFPQPKVIVAAGFTVSLLMGGLLALASEGLTRGLYTAKQVEQTLGLQTLAMVPQITRLSKGKKRHHYIVDKPRSAYAEALRSIQVSLMYAGVKSPPRTIMLTSSLPGEGKTTVAVSLATSLARSGLETVLVDLDLRNPSVGKELTNPKIDAGVADYLRGVRTLDEIMRHDDQVPNLDIIPATIVPANPLDYLGSEELSELITELRERYDYVLLDAPPTLGLTDARMVAHNADCILFVVQWGKTTIDVATNAVEVLLETETPFAGAVLNQVNIKRHAKLAYGDATQHFEKYKRYYVD